MKQVPSSNGRVPEIGAGNFPWWEGLAPWRGGMIRFQLKDRQWSKRLRLDELVCENQEIQRDTVNIEPFARMPLRAEARALPVAFLGRLLLDMGTVDASPDSFHLRTHAPERRPLFALRPRPRASRFASPSSS